MKINDKDEFVLSPEEILENDEIKKKLTQYALFDEMLVDSVIQWLLNDRIEWDKDDNPWWVCSSGQSRISKVRHALLPLVDEILRNEVTRTRQECNAAKDQAQERYSEMRNIENMLHDVYRLGYKHGETKADRLWPQTKDNFKNAIIEMDMGL